MQQLRRGEYKEACPRLAGIKLRLYRIEFNTGVCFARWKHFATARDAFERARSLAHPEDWREVDNAIGSVNGEAREYSVHVALPPVAVTLRIDGASVSRDDASRSVRLSNGVAHTIEILNHSDEELSKFKLLADATADFRLNFSTQDLDCLSESARFAAEASHESGAAAAAAADKAANITCPPLELPLNSTRTTRLLQAARTADAAGAGAIALRDATQAASWADKQADEEGAKASRLLVDELGRRVRYVIINVAPGIVRIEIDGVPLEESLWGSRVPIDDGDHQFLFRGASAQVDLAFSRREMGGGEDRIEITDRVVSELKEGIATIYGNSSCGTKREAADRLKGGAVGALGPGQTVLKALMRTADCWRLSGRYETAHQVLDEALDWYHQQSTYRDQDLERELERQRLAVGARVSHLRFSFQSGARLRSIRIDRSLLTPSMWTKSVAVDSGDHWVVAERESGEVWRGEIRVDEGAEAQITVAPPEPSVLWDAVTGVTVAGFFMTGIGWIVGVATGGDSSTPYLGWSSLGCLGVSLASFLIVRAYTVGDPVLVGAGPASFPRPIFALQRGVIWGGPALLAW